jgi:predicted ArsR family transcriptional regulator
MATAELTDRQQEIIHLLDVEKLTPPQIAEKLKISVNAVYQQMRRIRQRNGGSPAPSTPRSRGKSSRRASRPRPAPQANAAHVTPLQAIRARRDGINAELRDSHQALQHAQTAAKRAAESHDKLKARHAEELKQLNAAERALGHKPPTPRKRSGTKAKSAAA